MKAKSNLHCSVKVKSQKTEAGLRFLWTGCKTYHGYAVHLENLVRSGSHLLEVRFTSNKSDVILMNSRMFQCSVVLADKTRTLLDNVYFSMKGEIK